MNPKMQGRILEVPKSAGCEGPAELESTEPT